jgi:hypothetical protein
MENFHYFKFAIYFSQNAQWLHIHQAGRGWGVERDDQIQSSVLP